MKKFKLLLLFALLATPFIQSCNSKADQPSMYAVVTIKTYGLTYYGLVDNGEKIWIGDNSLVPNYTPKDGQRAVIYFTPLETPMEGFTYNAKVYAISNIETKPVILLTDPQYDTLGTDGITITSASISGGYLNLDVNVRSDGYTKHDINLVDNQVLPVEEQEGYISLELRHNSKGFNGGQLLRGMICFKLDMYDPNYITGCKGLYIRHIPVGQEGTNPEYEYTKVSISNEK